MGEPSYERALSVLAKYLAELRFDGMPWVEAEEQDRRQAHTLLLAIGFPGTPAVFEEHD